MNFEFKSFPGKILLFGEYLVINGGVSLATPIQNFSGRLMLTEFFQEDNIAPFIQYLGALPNIYLNQDLIEKLDLDRLIFKSNIPIGYGAGSSGALTAAVFDVFVEKYEGTLQEALASMEDFFHGSSSGLDPLISYLKKPSSEINKASLEYFYLLDTGISRKTAPLVEIFKMKSEEVDLLKLEEYNVNAVKAIKALDIDLLKRYMELISDFQYKNFQEMIPDGFKKIWKSTLNDKFVDLKLCGAGGGGFLLLFALEEKKAKEWALRHRLEITSIKVL